MNDMTVNELVADLRRDWRVYWTYAGWGSFGVMSVFFINEGMGL
jgi:hypothetical protein